MKTLISSERPQYKANLHSHSTLSDGKLTPMQMKELYKNQGYDILAITDHEFPCDHSHMTDSDFLMLTGYECYIRDNEDGGFDPYAREIHLNLFAREPHNTAFVCHHPVYTKYFDRAVKDYEVELVGSREPRRYNREYIQSYIDTALDNGYLVAYNHAYWSLEDVEDILSYEGLFSMEMRNGGAFTASLIEYNAALYDVMLRHGKRLYCHAGDDNHNKHPIDSPMSDSFVAWTKIIADKLDYPSVINALERGDFYSSSGPEIYSLTSDNGVLHIETSPARHIVVYTGSKMQRGVHIGKGESITCADIEIDKKAMYVRVSVFDEYGNSADTRAYFPEEL